MEPPKQKFCWTTWKKTEKGDKPYLHHSSPISSSLYTFAPKNYTVFFCKPEKETKQNIWIWEREIKKQWGESNRIFSFPFKKTKNRIFLGTIITLPLRLLSIISFFFWVCRFIIESFCGFVIDTRRKVSSSRVWLFRSVEIKKLSRALMKV